MAPGVAPCSFNPPGDAAPLLARCLRCLMSWSVHVAALAEAIKARVVLVDPPARGRLAGIVPGAEPPFAAAL